MAGLAGGVGRPAPPEYKQTAKRVSVGVCRVCCKGLVQANARLHIGLVVDACDVALQGPPGDSEIVGHLVVGVLGGDQQGEHLGLTKTKPLVPGTPLSEGWQTGSGLIGELPKSVEAYEFLAMVKSEFNVEKLSANRVPRGRMIRRVALCGGAGDFLLDEALRQGADAFLTGEMHYHQYFGLEDRMLIGVLGHYESEQYTIQLLKEILEVDVDDVPIYETQYNTNPIQYL